MQTNEALYFPDTGVDLKDVFEELLLFDHIYYYQAAENEDPTGLEQQGLITGYPPVPLGDDLERFNRLITELKGHEQEFYHGQLSGLALRNLEYRDEKNVEDIISTFTGGKDRKDEPDSREALWHYRLLLKLAEIKKREDEELARDLAEISEKESSLFEFLKGDPEIEPHLPDPAPAGTEKMAGMADIRLKAWAHLYLNDDRRRQILLTADKDAAESLFEAHTALNGGRLPVRICRLTLPLLQKMDKEAWLNLRNAFRGKARKIITDFGSLFADLLQFGGKEDTLQRSTMLAAEWGSFTEDMQAEPKAASASCPQNRQHLEIYLCEQNLAAILARHCRLNPDPGGKNEGYGLIALKTSRSVTCTD